MSVQNDSLGIIQFLISLAHFDGDFCKAERSFVKERLAALKLGEDERAILQDDIYNPKNPQEVFETLSPRARARSLDAANALIQSAAAEIDEKELIRQLRDSHLKEVGPGNAFGELNKVLRDAKEISKLRDQNNRLRLSRSFWRSLVLFD